MRSQPLRYLASILALAAVYFGAAKLGLSMASLAEQVTLVWPPTGISLAAILLFGYRVWPGIFLGAFLANATSHEPLPVACGIALGNTLEALLGAWLLHRLAGFANALERLKDVLGLVVLAAGVSTTVSASLGVTTLCLGGVKPWDLFGPLWLDWWLGDAMGDLVMAPVLLTWVTRYRAGLGLQRVAEAGALLVGLVAMCALVFTRGRTAAGTSYPLEYAVFPFVIWAALRFGQVGSASVTFLALSIAVGGTVSGSGPFAGRGTAHEALLLLQLYKAVVAVTALLLGAAIAERKGAVETLKEEDRRKDEFLAMLAHELRNPLAPIRNAVQVLRLVGPAHPKLTWAQDVLDRQVQQLTRLVDDLLDVSRITRGKIKLQKEAVELATVVVRAVETSRPLIEARKHECVVNRAPERIWIEADPTRLAQVLANLLNNAAKYTPDGGRIWLTTKREGNEAVIQVRDTGMGILAEMLPHVFDLFTQGERALDRSQGGLGIGLTLVRSLVEMHGGKVQAFSAGPDRGSEFVIRLPLLLRSEPPGSTHRVAIAAAPQRSTQSVCRRVLVVEDNADAALSLALLLQAEGHKVRMAHDGEAALELARTFQPEVVLLDIGLPGLDGYEVARRLREDFKETLLVAQTGYGQEEDRRRSQEAGFDHHLVKPVDPHALMALLDNN